MLRKDKSLLLLHGRQSWKQDTPRTPGPAAEMPRSPPAGERGGRLAAWAGVSPFPPIPASSQRLGPHATYSHFEEASCLWGPPRPQHRRGTSGTRRSAGARRHRAGKVRRGDPRSECPELAGTAAAPALQPWIAVPAKTPPLAP